MDEKVLEVQEWLNKTYGNNSQYKEIDEDGITGTKTCRALIQGLQIELGVSADGIFGEDTEKLCTPIGPNSNTDDSSIKRRIQILQGGLFCKGEGLNPVDFNGVYTDTTELAVKAFQERAGLSTQDGIADAMIMKALLNTDAYTLLANGDTNIRTMQRALNRDYHEYIGLIPCDGVFARKTMRALISALQAEEKKEYSNTVVDGIWGPTTMNRCPTLRRYGTVTNKQYVYILQYALYVNGFDPNGFDGGFGAGVQNAVTDFQEFVGLSADGIVGKQTWASLMVSYGDQDRAGTACDCKRPLTSSAAQFLVNDGRRIVGRYLTGGSNKRLTVEELEVIRNAGLKVVPIFQTTNNYKQYFTSNRGATDAINAYEAMNRLNFPDQTIVYVAVDFDASTDDIEDYISRYFAKFKEKMNELSGGKYRVGIYGPRYVCTCMRNKGYTSSSFVCDMSSGFLCNIGYPLPQDWAFDQIKTIDPGRSDLDQYDNVIASGRDAAQTVTPKPSTGITDKERELSYIAKATNICNCFGRPLCYPGEGYEFNSPEVPILVSQYCDVYFSAQLNAELGENTVVVFNIEGGKFEDSSVSSVIGNLYAEKSIQDILTFMPDFEALAAEIGSGQLQVGLEISGDGKQIIVYLCSVIYKNQIMYAEDNLGVTLEYVFKLDAGRPDFIPQEIYDQVDAILEKVKAEATFVGAFALILILLMAAVFFWPYIIANFSVAISALLSALQLLLRILQGA